MKRFICLLAAILIVSSCSHVISKPVRAQARRDVPFSILRQNIDQYKGSVFILGGTVVSTTNTDEGSVIEVVQTNVDRWGNIIDPDRSGGRFLAIEKGYLDPMIYKKGREVTIAGELIGSRTKKLGDAEYAYPVFAIKEIYLWKEQKYYYYYPSHYPAYMHRYPYWWNDPWWYGPYFPYPYP